MSNSFKIPKHLSSEFNRLKPEGREELVRDYKNWYSHPLTEALLEDLSRKYDSLLEESENKSDFVSFFQSKYYDVRNKAKRKLLRTILEQLDYRL